VKSRNFDLIWFDFTKGVQTKAKSHDKTLRHNAATPVGTWARLPKEKPDLALSDFSGSTALRFGLMAGIPVPCACRRHMAEALLVTLQHP